MRRSPIEMMVDRACGFDPDAPSARQDFVILRCPECKKQRSVDREKSDPPGTVVVETSCLDCHKSGDFENVDYFNVKGEQINLDGKPL